MDKRKIKQLVQASITENQLDTKKINRIAELLTKKELKEYIQGLKIWLQQNTIVVEVPKANKEYTGKFQSVFPGKIIIVKENPSLLLGMRIQDNDDIYDISLRNNLNQITNYVTEQYDR